MGAESFFHKAKGKTAKEAFTNAVEEAAFDYGHGGYSGTIAEKHDFILIPCPKNENPIKYAEDLVYNNDKRVEDKWGPAGCVKLNGDEYLFFGWASS